MDDDNENTSQTENKGIEEPAGMPAQRKAPTVLEAKTPFSNRILLEKRDAQRPPEVLSSLPDDIADTVLTQRLEGRCLIFGFCCL